MPARYQIMTIADYVRVLKDRKLIGTYDCLEQARAAIAIDKIKSRAHFMLATAPSPSADEESK